MTTTTLTYEPFYELEQLLGPVFYHSYPYTAAFKTAQTQMPRKTLELPGVKKEDVQLSVHNNVLAISTETQISSEHKESDYSIRERRYGKLSRSLRLPPGINERDVTASMADGLLTITFPRSSPEQEPKKIPIA